MLMTSRRLFAGHVGTGTLLRWVEHSAIWRLVGRLPVPLLVVVALVALCGSFMSGRRRGARRR